jgi:hypothetical protein
MTFQNLFIPHERTADEAAWLEGEIAAQAARHAGIVAAMEALTPQREIWYAEFLQRIQERGYNADGDQRVKISLADIPLKPDRPHRVTY